MPLFKSGPNLPADERARVEYHLQQIADCIGRERFQLPVHRMDSLIKLGQLGQSPREIAEVIGQHLSHPIGDLKIQVIPEVVQKVGGGG